MCLHAPYIARLACVFVVGFLACSSVSLGQDRPSPPANVTIDGWNFKFADRFDYDVPRSGGDNSLFTSHGWKWIKATNFGGSGSGHLFTQWDSTMESSVLVMEARPTAIPGFPDLQTDFFLQYGGESSSLSTIPADAWIQFWTYATPESLFSVRDKVIYPTRSIYPSNDLGWLFFWGSFGYQRSTSPAPDGGRYIGVYSDQADHRVGYDPGFDWGGNRKLFQNVNSRVMLPGIWYQVRLHFDTSGQYINPTNGQPSGVYEAWIRARGETAWTKVADYRPGVTGGPNGLYWPLTSAQRAGHRAFRMPTTVNNFNNTVLIDDFVISEDQPPDDLP